VRQIGLTGGEGVNQATQRLRLQIGRARWRRGEFAADDEGRLQYVDDTLHLERLHEFAADLGVVEQLLADALDGLAHRLDVGRRLQVQVEFHDGPVAAIIGDRLDLPKRDRVHPPVLVTQPHRPLRHSLDGAAQPAGVDILTNPEGVLHQKEDARDHIAHQALRAKADSDADDA
jgi:hypothetical protein